MSRRSATTTKVFVGSLPPNVTTEDLRKLFAPYGAIAECDIANRCGFLHLEDKDLAMKAISELNNSTFMGGKITVEKGRVKPPNRGRGRDGGPMRGGGRDRGGPYSRDGGYGRPRNGGFRDPWDRAGGDRYDRFDDRGMGPRGGYDSGYDRRPPPPPFDDRHGGAGGGFMGDRRPYNNGYGNYGSNRRQGGYEETGPAGYGRDGPMDASRPPAPTGGGYDRNGGAGNEMFSRRGDVPPGPKPLMSGSGYSAPNNFAGGAAGYSDTRGPTVSGGYGDSTARPAAGYDTRGAGPTPAYTAERPIGGYTDRSASYGTDTRAPPQQAPAAGYTNTSTYGTSAGGYGTATSADYSTTNQGYATSQSGPGGYGDSYNSAQRGNYDTAYPPLGSWRGGFSSGGSGPGQRRDVPPARRY